MRLILFLARVFIDTFGITRPAPKDLERTARFIAALLVGVLLAIIAVGVILHFAFHPH